MGDSETKCYDIVDFCCGHPFTHKGEIRKLIRALRNDGRNSSLVSASLLNPKWVDYECYWDNVLSSEEIIKISSLSQIGQLQPRVQSGRALLICLFPPLDPDSRRLWKSFKRLGYDLALLGLGPLPLYKGKIRETFVYRLAKTITRHLKKRFFVSPDVWITAGAACRQIYADGAAINRHAHYIPAHTFDFEQYRDFEICNNFPGKYGKPVKRSILFLDQGFTTHPDRYLNPHGAPITVEGTYSPIIRFLENCEQRFKMQAVVAPHPKVQVDGTKKIFANLHVGSESTLELIQRAGIVVAHSSTAVQWAILLEKPLLLISTTELEKTRLSQKVQGIARALGIQVTVLAPHKISVPNYPAALCERAYKNYVHNYVKEEESAKNSLAQILTDNL